MADDAEWIGAAEALARLGVRAQTLYAYVSRGKVEARPDPDDPKRSLYSGTDVAALARKRRAGRRMETVAAGTMAWGEPILGSAVSTVRSGRLIYRGTDAATLSEHATFEETAALLWEADASVFDGAGEEGAQGEDPFVSLARLAGMAAPALGRGPRSLHGDAVAVVRTLAAAQSRRGRKPGEPIHEQLARGLGRPAAADLLRRALVVLADHELNASTFAVRVAASTGASLAASALAGLCALSGPLHGSAGIAVADLVDEAEKAGAAAALRARIAQGAPISAFGHPLYSGLDPRAAALLAHLDLPPAYERLRTAAEQVLGLEPNVDFALAALVAVHRLPRETPFAIFALARSAGWMAHAMEQGRERTLIRPRARYTGPSLAR